MILKNALSALPLIRVQELGKIVTEIFWQIIQSKLHIQSIIHFMKQKWRRITSPGTAKNFHLIRCDYVLKIVKRISYAQQIYIEHLLCENEKN